MIHRNYKQQLFHYITHKYFFLNIVAEVTKMFSSNPNYTKLKTHLRLAINRLKLLEKKKTELAQKARKEIAEYIAAGKSERAKIRVEHIIRFVKRIDA